MKIGVVMGTVIAISSLALDRAEVRAVAFEGFAAVRNLATELVPVQDGDGFFHGIGVVTATEPDTGALTVNHQEIKGLMPPMEMLFNVSPRSLGDGVKAGDKIEFELEGKTYTIRALKVIERAR